MNMQNLMAQAGKIQRDMQKKKEKIDNSTFTGESEWVKVEINGKKEVQKIQILFDGPIDNDDKEALEDMLKIAFNKASTAVDKEMENEMGSLASGFGGLF